MGYTYREAGVDIDAGNKAVELMKPAVARTMRPEVLGGLGGFGGLFALNLQKYPNPVLVSGTDGVGTKLKLAFKLNQHDSIGIDAVAMCVNDILVQGAEPLFFLDYLAVGKLDPEQVASVVKGVAAGCELAGCALIGGETAEMPGFYPVGEYDIAGFAVGVVNREDIITGSNIEEGDILVGLRSSGLHSNGYSLARKVFEEYSFDKSLPELGGSLAKVLLEPTRIYVKPVLSILEKFKVKGMAHITGGGLTENIPRVLPDGCGVEINLKSWVIPPVFKLMQEIGKINEQEMYRTFNMGIGFVLIINAEDEEDLITELKEMGEDPILLGKVVKGNEVKYR